MNVLTPGTLSGMLDRCTKRNFYNVCIIMPKETTSSDEIVRKIATRLENENQLRSVKDTAFGTQCTLRNGSVIRFLGSERKVEMPMFHEILFDESLDKWDIYRRFVNTYKPYGRMNEYEPVKNFFDETN